MQHLHALLFVAELLARVHRPAFCDGHTKVAMSFSQRRRASLPESKKRESTFAALFVGPCLWARKTTRYQGAFCLRTGRGATHLACTTTCGRLSERQLAAVISAISEVNP